MILYVHLDMTDKLIMNMADQFVSALNYRQNRFGKFVVN